MWYQLVAALAVALAATPSHAWTVGQEVKTTSGTVKGIEAPWPANSGVSAYLGIQYAEHPVGPLRFAPPKRFNSNASIPGHKFSDDCLQGIGQASAMKAHPAMAAYGEGMGGGDDHVYSEKCLSVNVWTKPQVGEKKKAVLVWIYGGAFSAGTSNAPFYDGARLANDEDVVVVSLNYRINLFGFPGTPGKEQNFGLLDQRMAVEWVRDNIAAFGGDPERIVLFGESAGGASVDIYAYAWTEDPIVSGFIAQSGTAGLLQASGNYSETWYQISRAVGCGGGEAGEATIECMRGVDAQKLVTTMETVAGGSGVAGLASFGPVADGQIVFDDYAARGKAGKFIQKPFVVGNTHNEGGLFTFIASALSAGGNSSDGGLGDLLAGLGDFDPISMVLACPSGPAAQVRVDNKVPVWRFRYMGVWPNTALSPDTGAYHSSEVPMVFGATERKTGATPNTSEQEATSKFMMHAWASFAKNPTTALVKLGWPIYSPTEDTLLRIGYDNQSALNLARGDMYDGTCNMFGGDLNIGALEGLGG